MLVVFSVLAILGCLNSPLVAQPLAPVSVPDPAFGPADGGSGDSLAPLVSPDGRYVLFASSANNLVLIGGNSPVPAVSPSPLNVFLRDRASGTTTLISVNAAGTGGGNDSSWPVALSTNGQYVLFESNASNLVAGDTNNATDVFVRDLVNRRTLLVSAGTNRTAGNGASFGSAMTPDGRYVVFDSGAANLVPNDTNGIPDVFVRDLQTGLTTLVSVGASSGPALNFPTTSSPDITPDGRYVVFTSIGTNIVPGVQTAGEIYVRDLVTGTCVWASRGATQAVQDVFNSTNAASFNYAISADGQFVAYEARPPSGSAGAILRYSRLTDLTDLVHTNATAFPPGDNRSLDMTPDGRFIAFVANTNGPPGTNSCILVWDAQSGAATLASADPSGHVPANSLCASPAMDDAGRFVAFLSTAANLVTNNLAGDYHLFVRDMQAGATVLVDSDTNGVGTTLNTAPAPSLSADGRFVAFESPDGNLVPRDSNRRLDVFVSDLASGALELVSGRASSLPSTAPDGPSTLSLQSVSSDGRYVAFASDADNLVVGDTNGRRDVFVRDLMLGTNLLVSVSTNNSAPGDNPSTDAAISGDHHFVAFSSSADNLVAGDNNNARDVFVRDLQASTTVLVSVNTSGVGPGNYDSYSPVISSDGRFVLFRSTATDLVPGSFVSGSENLFLRDLQSGTTVALTTGCVSYAAMTPDGHYVAFVGALSGFTYYLYVWDSLASTLIYTNNTSMIGPVAISPDGSRVVYQTSSGLFIANVGTPNAHLLAANPLARRPGLRFSADSRFLTYVITPRLNINQVYLFDFQTGTNLLVSRSYNSTAGGNGRSDSPDISADGRFVAYRSTASDIVPGDGNGVPDIFLYDRQTAVTTLLSVSRFGSYTADNRSRLPVFSGDGQTLFFESSASDLDDRTFNFNAALFAFQPYSSAPITLFRAAIVPGAQGPWLTWPALPGKTYRVQFKSSLSDPQWLDLNGNVSVVGGAGYLKDVAPASAQRFYRVRAF